MKSMSSFRSISANGSVTFKLVQGEEKTKALSTSMADANYSVSNGTLNVNGNGTMTIAVGGYTSINCNACNVESSGALITIRWPCPYMRGSAKFTDLNVSRYLQLNVLNTGTYEFSGTVPFFNATCVNLAKVKAYDLITDSTYVNTTCAVDTEVHATKVINVFINSAGNVNYKGSPPVLRRSGIGSGKLVEK